MSERPDPIGPVPFRLSVPGKDEIDGLDVRSISIKVEGLATWSGDLLRLEWVETRSVDEVSVARIHSEVRSDPPLIVDITGADLFSASLEGGWWRPRIVLRSSYLDAFARIPGGRPGRLVLRIARRDRPPARALVAAVQWAIADARHRELAPPASTPPAGSTPPSGSISAG